MKTQKLLVIAAIVCLLVGASGAAMAATVCGDDSGNPEDGYIEQSLVVGNVQVTGNCVLDGITIVGNVIANLEHNEVLVVNNALILGKVKVTGGSAAIVSSLFPGGGFVSSSGRPLGQGNRILIDNIDEDTLVQANIVQGGGNILVRGGAAGDSIVYIQNNTVLSGNIRCVGTVGPTGSAGVLATGNVTPLGVVTCFGQ